MIRILDSFVADKIAAGEVLERPVSAIKELIENSIDAGADSIIVEIRGGGLTYMRVTDDGSGIAASEIETAFLRHATSKIETASDLDNITSLGFRGEALASISAVSRLTIVSRASDEQNAVKLVIHAGRVIQREKVGANIGTTMIAEDLFYNTPARRKFMKSAAREASAIIELVQQYAVYYSDIRFMMINNGETLFSTAGDGDPASVIRMLYPDNAHSHLIRVDGNGIKGYISPPSVTLSSRKGFLFYVNGRPVSSKIIEKALTDGYDGRIFSGYPVAVLFIDEDPHSVDVNIHPGKREILFLHADELATRIKNAVSGALSSESSIASAGHKIAKANNTIYDPAEINTSHEANITISEQSNIRDYLSSLNRDIDDAAGIDDVDNDDINTVDEQDASESVKEVSFDFDELVIKGYVFNTYIITEAGNALYVFDQHAAHERIYYEKLSRIYNSAEKSSQQLLSPIMLNLSADVYQMTDLITESLTSLGYDISDFGAGTLILRAIPLFMSAGEAAKFAEAFCESIEDYDAINDTVIDKLIIKSCKSAVKGGDRLSDKEIGMLIDELSLCVNPYSCPHGRPTFIKISKYDAERLFKRK